MQRGGLWVVALALAVAGAVPARADDSPPPSVNAQRFQEIPAGLAIAVEPRDDSDDNLALAALIRDALADRQRVIADSGPLRLRFSAAVLSDRDLSTGGATGRGERGAGMGRRGGAPLPDRAVGSGRARPVGAVRHRVTASLEQRADGVVLWRGEVTVTGSADDARQRGRRLAGALAEALGDTRRPSPPPEPPAPAAR